MITLQDFLDSLAASELANLKLGNNDHGTIEEQHIPKVVNALNQSLTKVHQRLNLRQGTLILHQQTGVETYYLRSEYTEEAGLLDEDYYIEVTDDTPFEDDIVKLLAAVDSAGNEVRINDRAYPADLFTPSFDVVTKTAPSTTIINADGTYRNALDTFTITYQATYPKIVVNEHLKPHLVEINVPLSTLEPLLLFTTYKLTKRPVKIAKGEKSPQQTLLIEFENAIRELKTHGLDMDDNTTNQNLDRNGWV